MNNTRLAISDYIRLFQSIDANPFQTDKERQDKIETVIILLMFRFPFLRVLDENFFLILILFCVIGNLMVLLVAFRRLL